MEILCLNAQLKKTFLLIQSHTIGEIVVLTVLVVPKELLEEQVKETFKNTETRYFRYFKKVRYLKLII